MRLANDATYVRATFSNRLSVFVQDLSSILVALTIAVIMQWRFGLVALATMPLLAFASITQVCPKTRLQIISKTKYKRICCWEKKALSEF